jgi:hypothetical protein
MRQGLSQAGRVVPRIVRPAVFAAVFFAISSMVVLANGCGGEAAEIPNPSLAQASATTSTFSAETTTTVAPETTTSTLSQHERVQQEQVQQEAQTTEQGAHTTGSAAPAKGVFDVEEGKTLLLGDGGVLTSEEVEGLNDYVSFATDAEKEQQRLSTRYNSLMSKTHKWTKSDYSSFKSLISAEKALLSDLNGTTAPQLYLVAHQERTRAAQLFVDAWQKIYTGDPGGTPTKDKAAVDQGLSDNLKGVDTWHSAENTTQTVTARVMSGQWR